jgi:hypothetical protein
MLSRVFQGRLVMSTCVHLNGILRECPYYPLDRIKSCQGINPVGFIAEPVAPISAGVIGVYPPWLIVNFFSFGGIGRGNVNRW